MNIKGKELMVMNIETTIKNILVVNIKTTISMKWKDQNKGNQNSDDGEKMKLGEKENQMKSIMLMYPYKLILVD